MNIRQNWSTSFSRPEISTKRYYLVLIKSINIWYIEHSKHTSINICELSASLRNLNALVISKDCSTSTYFYSLMTISEPKAFYLFLKK